MPSLLTPLVVLWLGASPAPAEQRAELLAWAAEHSVSVRAPAPPVGPRYDARVVDDVEALLDEARAAANGAAKASAFERAEALLLAHPELPQASWLLAERYALEAALVAPLARDVEVRSVLLDRARALEGERATPAGTAAAALVAPKTGLVLHIDGMRAGDRLLVNGMSTGAQPVLAPGRHHVELRRGSERVIATWLMVDADHPPSLRDPTSACSALDLSGVVAKADRPEPAPGVACERWAVARARLSGGTEVARCQASSCGPWEIAGKAAARPADGGAAGEADVAGAWPSWLTWGLLGTGAAAATGIVLWQTGAFERDAPATEFVFTGPSASAYRF